MGVKANLAAIVLTAGDITAAETQGTDLKGLMSIAGSKCDDLRQLLSVISALMTAGGDGGNATTVNTQSTALA